jgi:hypothetical protein
MLYAGTAEQNRRLQVADAVLCAQDFLHWIDAWGVIRNEKVEQSFLIDTPFQLWPSQVGVVNWLFERMSLRQIALIAKSKEIGISWLIVHLLYWGWRFHGWTSLIGSRIEDLVDRSGDLDSLMGKLRYIHAAQPPHLKEQRVLSNHLIFQNLRNKARVVGQRTTMDFGRGGRGKIVFIDEYPSIPPRVQEGVIRGTESYGALRVLIGNPQGDRTYEYQLWRQLPKECVLELDWRTDPYRDEEWRRSKLLSFGLGGALTDEQFDREYGALHTSLGAGNLIFRYREDTLGYDDSSEEWRRVRDHARARWFNAGGWDFGSGPSLLACMLGLVDFGPEGNKPELWIDNEAVFQQTDWRTAGASVLEASASYGGMRLHFGDPAGEQHDSAQTSWISNLNAAGIPLIPVSEWFNSEKGKEWMIKTAQALMDEGRLHVHRAKCPVLWEALKNWKRDVQDWVDIMLVSRTYIAPRKDRYSHPCEALLYLVAGVIFYSSQSSQTAPDFPLPERASESMGAIFRGVRRGR